MLLNKASSEQKECIDYIDKMNIVVNAIAGSGKTTTILHIAKYYTNKKILVLTYNSKLKVESREKAKKLNLNNIEIHSFHAFCVKYYDSKCYTDNKIIDLIDNNKKFDSINKKNYDIVIIDEAQDFTLLYFKLVCKIVNDFNLCSSKFCILGDVRQSIYGFNNADSRFISNAKKIFKFNNFGWKRISLNTSYRLTNKISNFINNCTNSNVQINTIKNGPSVDYIIYNAFGTKNYNYLEQEYIERYDPSEIFILAPSVKPNKNKKGGYDNDETPLIQFANKLSKNYPLYVSNNDNEKIDNDLIKNKIVITTFHQAKGLERKLVIVFSFDDKYYKYYNKNKNPNIMANEIYVAITRSSKKLVLLHHYKNNYFKFLNKKNLSNFTKIIEKEKLFVKKNDKNDKNKVLSVTELIKYKPSTILYDLKNILYIKKIKKSGGNKIDIVNKTKQNDLYEDVSNINGIALPAIHQFYKQNKIDILKNINNLCILKKNYILNQTNSKDIFYINNAIKVNKKSITIDNININFFLRLSNLYDSIKEQYIHKYRQIKCYDWLGIDEIKKAIKNIDNLNIDNNFVDEVHFSFKNNLLLKNKYKYFCGFIDRIDYKNNTIWEFKCTSKINDVHFIQLALYMYLFSVKQKNTIIANSLEKNDEILYLNKKYKKIRAKIIDINIGTEKGNTCSINKLGKNKNKNKNINTINFSQIIKNVTKVINYNKKINSFLSNYKFYLFNIITNEQYLVESKFIDLYYITNKLFHCHFYDSNISSDDKFFADCDYWLDNICFDSNKNIPTSLNINNNDNIQINGAQIDSIKNCSHINNSFNDKNIISNNIDNNNMMILDLETDGYNNIVEIAYNIFDKNFKITKKQDIFIFNDILVRDYFKKIPVSKFIEDGINIIDALHILKNDIEKVNCIICHNTNFDIRIIKKYFNRYNISCNIKNTFCTMKNTKNIVMARNVKNNIKCPKLSELYSFLFNKLPSSKKSHLGSYDVEITFRCLKKLIKKNYFCLNSLLKY